MLIFNSPSDGYCGCVDVPGEHSDSAVHIHRVRHVDAADTQAVRGGRRARAQGGRRVAAARPAGRRAAHHDAEHRRRAAAGGHTVRCYVFSIVYCYTTFE